MALYYALCHKVFRYESRVTRGSHSFTRQPGAYAGGRAMGCSHPLSWGRV